MITIFHGRKLALHGTEEVIYAEVAVALRDQIHHFNTGKSCNAFAVFMKIALHTDEYGWAFPSNRSISAGTGISTAHALAAADAVHTLLFDHLGEEGWVRPAKNRVYARQLGLDPAVQIQLVALRAGDDRIGCHVGLKVTGDI
jgi:hypothetical protein